MGCLFPKPLKPIGPDGIEKEPKEHDRNTKDIYGRDGHDPEQTGQTVTRHREMGGNGGDPDTETVNHGKDWVGGNRGGAGLEH